MTMNNKLFSVPRLEDLACHASYCEIIGNLLMCHEHRPEGKKLAMVTFSSFLSTNPFLTSKNMMKLVRARLDQHLVGLMSEQIRRKYAEDFYKLILQHEDLQFQDDRFIAYDHELIVDIWVFLNCVLDESFKELRTIIGFPDSVPNPKLISTIAKRSPLLEKLTLNFRMSFDASWESDTNLLKSLICPLSSLQHLTHLSLVGLEQFPLLALFSLLGKSCPLLTHLSVSGWQITQRDFLAIIVGELIDDLFPFRPSQETELWSEPDLALARLVVPSDCLPPMCFTLQELKFTWEFKTFRGKEVGISGSTAAFALRHLPSLKKMGNIVPTCLGIKKLYDADYTQMKFRKVCLEATDRRYGQSRSLLDTSSSSHGFLSLTTLDCVYVGNEDLLRAIGTMCPFLNKVTFIDVDYFDSLIYVLKSWYKMDRYTEDEDLDDDLGSLLSNWPKLTSITFKQVNPFYIASILKIFSPSLKNVAFKSCSNVTMADLVYCTQLENLRFLSSTFNFNVKISNLMTPDSFLPQLKSVESNVCLGVWSYLFEEKTTLLRLVLDCCHIGIDVLGGKKSEDQPRLKRFKPSVDYNVECEWSEIPNNWAQLEILQIKKCRGLTMLMLSKFIPLLYKVKKIALPKTMMPASSESHLHRDLIETISNSRVPPVHISFDGNSDAKCPFIEEHDRI